MIKGLNIIEPLQGASQQAAVKRSAACEKGGSSFDLLLDGKMNDPAVKFSGHALERLKERGINLSAPEIEKLQGAVSSVAAKGGKESLIMVGDAALVVSVKNRTVITAFDRRNLDGNVFTRIDSAAVF